ncbi:MAG TPA: hypothetical protein VGF48_20045 [Thermoanaerobaculia bacterium]|jgi:hypothetical protein
MAINVKILGKSMIEAARRAASQQWGEVAPVAETQLQNLAAAAGEIDALLRMGQINDDRARELFAMQRTAVQAVMQRNSKASAIAELLIDAAAAAIGGPLGGIIGGKVTAMFKAGKDL